MVTVVADILKFPWPLFPKYKKTLPVGFRFEVSGSGSHTYELNFPPGTKYELQSFVFGANEYSDMDYYSLYKNDDVIFTRIYTKDDGQGIEIRPVVPFDPSSDVIRFIFDNSSAIDKTIWIDLILSANVLVTSEIPNQSPIPVSMQIVYNGITDGSDTHIFDYGSSGEFDAIVTYSDSTTKNVTTFCNWIDPDQANPNHVLRIHDGFSTDLYHRKIIDFVQVDPNSTGSGATIEAEYMGITGTYPVSVILP
jgi:hypothetical protein